MLFVFIIFHRYFSKVAPLVKSVLSLAFLTKKSWVLLVNHLLPRTLVALFVCCSFCCRDRPFLGRFVAEIGRLVEVFSHRVAHARLIGAMADQFAASALAEKCADIVGAGSACDLEILPAEVVPIVGDLTCVFLAPSVFSFSCVLSCVFFQCSSAIFPGVRVCFVLVLSFFVGLCGYTANPSHRLSCWRKLRVFWCCSGTGHGSACWQPETYKPGRHLLSGKG